MDYIEEDWTIVVIVIGVCLMATAYVLVVLRCCLECVRVLAMQRYGGDDKQILDESDVTVISEEEYQATVDSIVLPIEKDSGIASPHWI